MKKDQLALPRLKQILARAKQRRIAVIGDVMLDQFIWGSVARISPEAPVPVVDFQRESFMPGGAANVARNLTALGAGTELFGVVGKDEAANSLRQLLRNHKIGSRHIESAPGRRTSLKTRVVAQRQQLVRIDRETRVAIPAQVEQRLIQALKQQLPQTDAVIVGDYGKGVVTQSLLNQLKPLCREHGVWLSLDPKQPIHQLNMVGVSVIKPNRKETFALANIADETRTDNPLKDVNLMEAARRLLNELRPAVLLITLGEQGILLCQRNQPPFHIPTTAQEVFDVSGAGDTVIAAFTLAIATGASPVEAAIFSNYTAGIVVGKIGTATASPEELLASATT